MMFIRSFLVSAVAFGSSLTAVSALPAPDGTPKVNFKPKFDYKKDIVRGVNLGGWLVLEPWITPKLFEGKPGVIDEYTFCEKSGNKSATDALESHWKSFITQEDIKAIAAAGLNHVRIPVGYWSIHPRNGDPYVQGAAKYLSQSLDWAQDAGLKVMIDLHGVADSQNGFDNSGKRGKVGWGDQNTTVHALETLNKLRIDYGSHAAVASIGLLNEPFGPTLGFDKIQQYWYDAWGNVIGNAKDNATVAAVFSDGFLGVDKFKSFGNNLPGLVLDLHHYQIYDNTSITFTPKQHITAACAVSGDIAQSNKATSPRSTIIGEWSGAMTDCAKWLNGKGTGSRYEGSFTDLKTGQKYTKKVGECGSLAEGKVKDLSKQQKTDMKNYIQAQRETYETGNGWIFWTWKTQGGAPGWNMQELLEENMFPNLDNPNADCQCGKGNGN